MVLQVLRSERLVAAGVRHGFFTRLGGVSPPPYDALNTSAATGDLPDHVAENLGRVASALEVPVSRLFVMSQVHGRAALQVHEDSSVEEVMHAQADAMLTATPGLACAVRVADCVPILVAEPRARMVAAIHSGWRGTLQDVVGEALHALVELGGVPSECIAAIGPHISLDSFEVGEEVAQTVARELSAELAARVIVRRSDWLRPHLDLRAWVTQQLWDRGVRAIDQVGGCTFQESALFYSHRRDGARSGRLIAAIVGPG